MSGESLILQSAFQRGSSNLFIDQPETIEVFFKKDYCITAANFSQNLEGLVNYFKIVVGLLLGDAFQFWATFL